MIASYFLACRSDCNFLSDWLLFLSAAHFRRLLIVFERLLWQNWKTECGWLLWLRIWYKRGCKLTFQKSCTLLRNKLNCFQQPWTLTVYSINSVHENIFPVRCDIISSCVSQYIMSDLQYWMHLRCTIYCVLTNTPICMCHVCWNQTKLVLRTWSVIRNSERIGHIMCTWYRVDTL